MVRVMFCHNLQLWAVQKQMLLENQIRSKNTLAYINQELKICMTDEGKW